MWPRPVINLAIIGSGVMMIGIGLSLKKPVTPTPPASFTQDEVPVIHSLTNQVDDSMFYASDDFQKYPEGTRQVTQTLLTSGRCSVEDVNEQGGWTKSMKDKKKPTYFMYCKNIPGDTNYSLSDKIYANLETGKIL